MLQFNEIGLNRRGDIAFTLSNLVSLIVIFVLVSILVVVTWFIGLSRTDVDLGNGLASSDMEFLFKSGLITIDNEEKEMLVFEAIARYWIDEDKRNDLRSREMFVKSREEMDAIAEEKKRVFYRQDIEDFFKSIMENEDKENNCLIFSQGRNILEERLVTMASNTNYLESDDVFLAFKDGEFIRLDYYNLALDYSESGLLKTLIIPFEFIEGEKFDVQIEYYHGECLDENE